MYEGPFMRENILLQNSSINSSDNFTFKKKKKAPYKYE